MKIIVSISLLSSLALLVGCNSTTAGSDDGLGNVSLKFSTSSAQTSKSIIASSAVNTRSLISTPVSGITVTDTSGNISGTIDLNSAWVVIKDIGFEAEGEVHTTDSTSTSTDDSELEFIGPYVLDVLTGTTYPDLSQIDIGAGSYRNIKINIEKLAAADAGNITNLATDVANKLASYSLYLAGTYTSADGTSYVDIPFSLSLSDEVEFSFAGSSSPKAFVIEDQGQNDIIIAFNLDEWFAFNNSETNSDSLLLESAITSSGSSYELVLDNSTNSTIMEVIKDNIEESAKYGKDKNGDGELEHDENNDITDD